nr:META domain-containing protein [uncultured Sphingomonas sp.]
MRRAAALSIASLLLAGCAPATSGLSLTGTKWTVTALNGNVLPADPAHYRIEFADEDLSAQFGCNLVNGNYKVRGETLTTSGTTMTEMACIGPADEQEAQGLNILANPMKIARRGPTIIILSNAAGSIALNRS